MSIKAISVPHVPDKIAKQWRLKTVFVDYPMHALLEHLVRIIMLPAFLGEIVHIVLECILKAFPKTEAKSLSKILDWSMFPENTIVYITNSSF